MWWWQRGCCGVCGHLVHPLAVLVLSTPLPLTHTHGVVGTWWWLCVCGVAATTTVPHSHQPPPLCPLPRPVRCACVCVVAPGTAAHCGGTHAGVCVCVAVCAPCPPHPPPTLSTLVASLSSLSPSHTCHSHSHMARLTPHTHMACFVCLLPSTHTHWLPHCPHARHTHTPLGVRAPIHLLSSATTHTHGTHRRGACMGGWACGHHHHAPCARHSHTHTQRDWWWAPWWCVVVWVWAVCASHATNHHAIPPTTTTNALVPPPTHTHTRDLVDAPLPHTHATCTTTLTNACCVVPTPCHSLTHATSHTHTHNGACHRSPRRPHTQRMPHTTQVRDQGHAHQWVWPLVSHHHHAGLGLSLCCVGGFLSTNPFSLSLIHPLPPPHPPTTTTTIPSIPCVWCGVWCGKGQHQAPQWW